jgi:hypothetical protein
MRTLQVGDRPTRLAQALAEFGRIDKTLHTLTYIDDENQRRSRRYHIPIPKESRNLRALWMPSRPSIRHRRIGRPSRSGAV